MSNNGDAVLGTFDISLLKVGREDVHVESALSAAEVEQFDEELRREWGINDEVTWQRVRVLMYTSFAVNGTSPRASFRGFYTVNGRRFPRKVVTQVLSVPGIRRFARGWTYFFNEQGERVEGTGGDFITLILSNNTEVAKRCAANYKAVPAKGYLCFDVANSVSNLSVAELQFVNSASKKSLKGADEYNELFDDDDEGDVLPLGGGGHNVY